MTKEDEELLHEAEVYPHLVLLSKADLPHAFEYPGALRISVRTGEGLKELREELTVRAGEIGEMPFTDARHMRLARRSASLLAEAAQALENGEPLDLAAVSLYEALDTLGGITGDRVDEKLLDDIFSRFCVGK